MTLWDHGKWIPAKYTNGTFKVLKVKVSFKAPKDGKYYKIEKRPGSGTTASDMWTTGKTGKTCTMWFLSGTKSATLKITVYNKNGIASTVSKKIKI